MRCTRHLDIRDPILARWQSGVGQHGRNVGMRTLRVNRLANVPSLCRWTLLASVNLLVGCFHLALVASTQIERD